MPAAKDIPCRKCGGKPEIYGAGFPYNEEGPWHVACVDCGRETISWAYQREARRQWKLDNEVKPDEKPDAKEAP